MNDEIMHINQKIKEILEGQITLANTIKKMNSSDIETLKIIQRNSNSISAFLEDYAIAIGKLTNVSPISIVERIKNKATELDKKKGV